MWTADGVYARAHTDTHAQQQIVRTRKNVTTPLQIVYMEFWLKGKRKRPTHTHTQPHFTVWTVIEASTEWEKIIKRKDCGWRGFINQMFVIMSQWEEKDGADPWVFSESD